MMLLLFPNLAKCYCTELIDSANRKGRIYTGDGCSDSSPLESNENRGYKYYVIQNIVTIPENWLDSASELIAVESSSVKYIGANAFKNVPTLESVSFTASGSGGYIRSQAFYNLKNLQSVTLGSAFSTIGESCFYGCSKLRDITFSDSSNSISIGSNAFENCNSLTSLTIYRPISSSDFPGWTDLRSITITSNYFSSPNTVFSECSSFLNIFFSSSVSSINTNAFKSWIKISTITIPSTIRTLSSNCFDGCKNLKMVTFSDSSNPISISSNAFANCNSLTSLIIGRPISSSSDFPGWNNLQSITITSNYFSSPYSVFSSISPFPNIEFSSSVTSISTNAFKTWRKISSILFLDSQNPISINSNAFANCDALTSLTIGRPISSSSDFPGWTNLQSITITSNYFSLPYSFFSSISPFPNIEFSSSVTSISTNAFKGWEAIYNSSQLNGIENIRSIGDFAFSRTNLTVINLSHCINLESIGNRAFANIESLQYVYLPHMTTIGQGCFENCVNLSDVSLPMKITEIQESAFENCSKLVSIPVPTSVECFNRRAFYGSGLKSIRIGYMVTVYSEAFACCNSLQRVELFDYAVVTNNAFSDSNQIKSLVIYEYVTVYSEAFSKVSNLSYFGLTDDASPITEKFLKSMNIKTIYVIEDYRYEKFCNISVTKQKANTEVCINEKKCSMAPYYSEHLRMAMAMIKKRR